MSGQGASGEEEGEVKVETAAELYCTDGFEGVVFVTNTGSGSTPVEKGKVMSDEERCRLIAELEGWRALAEPERWASKIPFNPIPGDYAHDLNATMRAARRLDASISFKVSSRGEALLDDTFNEGRKYPARVHGDPARAAFLALSDYLATRKHK